jgi:hypothetical protein
MASKVGTLAQQPNIIDAIAYTSPRPELNESRTQSNFFRKPSKCRFRLRPKSPSRQQRHFFTHCKAQSHPHRSPTKHSTANKPYKPLRTSSSHMAVPSSPPTSSSQNLRDSYQKSHNPFGTYPIHHRGWQPPNPVADLRGCHQPSSRKNHDIRNDTS